MKRIIGILLALPILIAGFGNGCSSPFQPKHGGFTLSSSSSTNQAPIFSAPFSCSIDPKASPQQVRRLLKIEYINTVENLFGGSPPPAIRSALQAIPEGIAEDGPRSFSHLVDQTLMDIYEQTAAQVLMQIRSSSSSAALLTSLGANCMTLATVTEACRTNTVNNLGLKALRRPLSPDELTKFRTAMQVGVTPAESVGFLLYALLLSPDFLLHLPLGNEPASDGQPNVHLNSYQIASRISYFLWDAPPDASLFQAAARDELQTPAQIEAQVERMLNMPKAKDKLHRFFQFWLRYKAVGANAYSQQFIAGLDVAQMNNDGLQEINEFIDHIFWTQSGSFRDLMTSRESFARGRDLASVYGHAPITGETPAMMPVERKGILTRLPVLMSAGNETHPILRGVTLRTNVLCEPMGAPVGVNLDDSELFNDEARVTGSTRQRTTLMTRSTSCMGCHSRINDLGFVMEGFDSLGRLRQFESVFNSSGEMVAQHPVDTRVDSLSIGSQKFYTNDTGELVEQMVDTPVAAACFARQVYRFYHFQMESTADSCVLKNVFEQLDTSSKTANPKSLREAFKKFVVNSAFTNRLK